MAAPHIAGLVLLICSSNALASTAPLGEAEQALHPGCRDIRGASAYCASGEQGKTGRQARRSRLPRAVGQVLGARRVLWICTSPTS